MAKIRTKKAVGMVYTEWECPYCKHKNVEYDDCVYQVCECRSCKKKAKITDE